MDCEKSLRAHVAAATAVSSYDSASRNARIYSCVWTAFIKQTHLYIAYGLLALCCTNSSGCCRLLTLANRTTRYEPSLYCAGCDETRSLDVYSQWADRAWSEQIAGCSDAVPSADYAFGFHAGFVDYCYAGGTGEPPPVPPRIYWNVELRSPEGQARARDWFEGYRQGARVARAGGYRETAVVASSTGLAVRSDQATYAGQGMPVQGYLGDMSAPAGGQPPLEALPAPPTSAPESGSRPPASSGSPPATMPKLTRPRTDSTPDGAVIKHKDTHVATAAYTTTAGIRAKAPIAKPVPTNDSREQSHQPDGTKIADRGAAVYRAGNCDSVSTHGHPQAVLGTREATASAAESRGAPPKNTAEKILANSQGGTETAELNGGGSDAMAPTVNERTTFVFKQ